MSDSTEIASAGPRRHFVNDPRTIVAEALAGFERANSTLVRWNREPSFVVRANDDRAARVGLLPSPQPLASGALHDDEGRLQR